MLLGTAELCQVAALRHAGNDMIPQCCMELICRTVMLQQVLTFSSLPLAARFCSQWLCCESLVAGAHGAACNIVQVLQQMLAFRALPLAERLRCLLTASEILT